MGQCGVATAFASGGRLSCLGTRRGRSWKGGQRACSERRIERGQYRGGDSRTSWVRGCGVSVSPRRVDEGRERSC